MSAMGRKQTLAISKKKPRSIAAGPSRVGLTAVVDSSSADADA